MTDMQGPNICRNDRNWFMLIQYTWKYLNSCTNGNHAKR